MATEPFALPRPSPPPALPSDPSPVPGVIGPPPPSGAAVIDTKASDDDLKQRIADSLHALELDPNTVKHALVDELGQLAATYGAEKARGSFIGGDQANLQSRAALLFAVIRSTFQPSHGSGSASEHPPVDKEEHKGEHHGGKHEAERPTGRR